MFDTSIITRENAIEFFEKVSLDNEDAIVSKESHPFSFKIARARKARGYRRRKAENRYRGQRDNTYQWGRDIKSFNFESRLKAEESESSIILRGLNDYIDELEDEQLKKMEKNTDASYIDFIVKEKSETMMIAIFCLTRVR